MSFPLAAPIFAPRKTRADAPLPNGPRRKDVESFYVQAEIPDGVLHDGWNDVELFNHGNDHTIEAHEIVWMEVALEGGSPPLNQ